MSDNNFSGFICPVCKNKLFIVEKSLKCKKNHSYDIAKSGYVNLLLSSQMNSKIPGDNKIMVNSRRDFLEKGYYSKLRNLLCETVLKHAKSGDLILDAGCGEGYYTSSVFCAIKDIEIKTKILGIDISKIAADTAAKRCKDVFYAAASIFHIPIEDKMCDILFTLFAPYCGEEFNRVLKNNGIMIMVIPSEKHLIQLKQAVYDNPYLNEVKDYNLDGFTLLESIKIHDEINLESNEDIQNLFTMTPYYYKTSSEDKAKLSALENLSTEIEFEILTYKKN